MRWSRRGSSFQQATNGTRCSHYDYINPSNHKSSNQNVITSDQITSHQIKTLSHHKSLNYKLSNHKASVHKSSNHMLWSHIHQIISYRITVIKTRVSNHIHQNRSYQITNQSLICCPWRTPNSVWEEDLASPRFKDPKRSKLRKSKSRAVEEGCKAIFQDSQVLKEELVHNCVFSADESGAQK